MCASVYLSFAAVLENCLPSEVCTVPKSLQVVSVCETEGDREHTPGYLSAPDSDRTKALVQAFRDPETSAVLCARGGYGCLRLLLDPSLSPSMFPVEVGTFR